jgi:hypothetical protein
MLTYSTRARISGLPGEALAWAQEAAKLVAKIGGRPVQLAGRVGGHSDIVWTTSLDDYSQLGSWLDSIQANADYAAMVKIAVEKGLFAPGSVEAAIWRSL